MPTELCGQELPPKPDGPAGVFSRTWGAGLNWSPSQLVRHDRSTERHVRGACVRVSNAVGARGGQAGKTGQEAMGVMGGEAVVGQ